jgi:hypothetical protein
MTHHVAWVDHGREPRCPPDPDFPDGRELDASGGAKVACVVALPYPAPRCGIWEVHCLTCNVRIAITAAGRPDDPKSVKLPCALGAIGRFPEDKIAEDDEGELTIAIGEAQGNVRIEFGKPVTWLGLSPDKARAFAQTILAHADSIEKGPVT